MAIRYGRWLYGNRTRKVREEGSKTINTTGMIGLRRMKRNGGGAHDHTDSGSAVIRGKRRRKGEKSVHAGIEGTRKWF